MPISAERKALKDVTFEEIMENCIAYGKEEWLEEAMNRKVEHWKYQKTTIIDENGKKRKVVDKTLPKKMEYRKPTFIELKEMYLVEVCGLAPAEKEEKEPTMAEKFAARMAALKAAKE